MRTRGKALVQAVGVRKRAPSVSPSGVTDGAKKKKKKRAARVYGKDEQTGPTIALPDSLVVLKDIFTGILAVYGMMKKRNKQTTYVAMKEGVENASKRRFDEKMLYQLKNLVPELIELETVPLLTGKTRNERTTVVKLGHVSMVEAKRLLDSALYEYASSSQSTGTAKDVPEWNPSCVEKTHLVPSPEPIEDAIQWISSPGSTGSDKTTNTPAASILQSPRKTTMRVRRARRLSFSQSAVSQQQKLDASQPVSSSGIDTVLDDMPHELRRRSLDGIISMASLKKLDENEREHRRLSGSEARATRSEKAALKSLPDMFHRIRSIFGRRGPKAIKLDDICRRIRSGGAELTALDDIAHRVQSLADHAPEFITIRPWGDVDNAPTVQETCITRFCRLFLPCVERRAAGDCSTGTMATKTSLGKLFDPLIARFAPAYQAAVGKELKKYGLRLEDLYDPENDLDVEEALDRLPQDVVDARNQRLKRAMDLSVKHSALPKDMQDKQTPFAFYMQDTLKQIEAENEERELLDSSRPNERHIP
ncbi:hypothetical protein M9434_004539 [Picochlorum sp. BPE23]|nr:hypothetical protein M9434_004539 [Picochlorum sp. BPE23]